MILLAVSLYSIDRLEKELRQQQSEINELKQRIFDLDPQFADERVLRDGFNVASVKGESTFLGMAHADLIKKKSQEGKPTLFDPFKSND